MKKLLFLVNVDWFFISHRLPIAIAALEHGYEVHVATGITDRLPELEAHGLIVHQLPIKRGKATLGNEFSSFLKITRILRTVKPDVLHLVTIKPVLYGGIAARLTRIQGVVAAISGLGYIFTSQGIAAWLRKRAIETTYRIALGSKGLRVIFQNRDDQQTLVRATGLAPHKTRLIPGSGVDLNTFTHTPPPASDRCIVTMASRLLTDKGVMEFAEAAEILSSKGLPVTFQLAGTPDPDNPASIPDNLLNQWIKQRHVNILGYTNNIPHLFSNSDLIVLPSYREGFPKVLIEAAACGRPVITTDVPGCRDAIIPDVTGTLVPARNSEMLATAVEKLVLNKSLRLRMGKAGRKLAEDRYSIDKVVNMHLDIYQELLNTI